MVAEEWIPIVFFIAAVAIVAIVMFYRTERAKAQAMGGGDYRKLAEEALATHRMLLDETQRMNASLKEIERLLREV